MLAILSLLLRYLYQKFEFFRLKSTAPPIMKTWKNTQKVANWDMYRYVFTERNNTLNYVLILVKEIGKLRNISNIEKMF